MHSAAPWRASTANTSSCTHDGSRSSTAHRSGAGAAREELVEPLDVAPPAGRQLHEVRAEVLAQPARRGRGGWGATRGVVQLHAVRPELPELHGVAEARRRLGGPPSTVAGGGRR